MILVFALAVLCVFIDVVASENQGQVLFVTKRFCAVLDRCSGLMVSGLDTW